MKSKYILFALSLILLVVIVPSVYTTCAYLGSTLYCDNPISTGPGQKCTGCGMDHGPWGSSTKAKSCCCGPVEKFSNYNYENYYRCVQCDGKTCDQLHATCGQLSDGCGSTLDCGRCDSFSPFENECHEARGSICTEEIKRCENSICKYTKVDAYAVSPHDLKSTAVNPAFWDLPINAAMDDYCTESGIFNRTDYRLNHSVARYFTNLRVYAKFPDDTGVIRAHNGYFEVNNTYKIGVECKALITRLFPELLVNDAYPVNDCINLTIRIDKYDFTLNLGRLCPSKDVKPPYVAILSEKKNYTTKVYPSASDEEKDRNGVVVKIDESQLCMQFLPKGTNATWFHEEFRRRIEAEVRANSTTYCNISTTAYQTCVPDCIEKAECTRCCISELGASCTDSSDCCTGYCISGQCARAPITINDVKLSNNSPSLNTKIYVRVNTTRASQESMKALLLSVIDETGKPITSINGMENGLGKIVSTCRPYIPSECTTNYKEYTFKDNQTLVEFYEEMGVTPTIVNGFYVNIGGHGYNLTIKKTISAGKTVISYLVKTDISYLICNDAYRERCPASGTWCNFICEIDPVTYRRVTNYNKMTGKTEPTVVSEPVLPRGVMAYINKSMAYQIGPNMTVMFGNQTDFDASIAGIIKDIAGNPIAGAKIDLIGHTLGTRSNGTLSSTSFSDEDGFYEMVVDSDVMYDVVVSKVQYKTNTTPGLMFQNHMVKGYDVVLIASDPRCEKDCTFVDDDVCHVECEGSNGCGFYDGMAQGSCHMSRKGWIEQYDEEKSIVCCVGSPQSITKSTIVEVVSPTNSIVRNYRIILYKGNLVRIVTDVYG